MRTALTIKPPSWIPLKPIKQQEQQSKIPMIATTTQIKKEQQTPIRQFQARKVSTTGDMKKEQQEPIQRFKLSKISDLADKYPSALLRKWLKNSIFTDPYKLEEFMRKLYKIEYSDEKRHEKNKTKRLLLDYYAFDAPSSTMVQILKKPGHLLNRLFYVLITHYPVLSISEIKDMLTERIKHMLRTDPIQFNYKGNVYQIKAFIDENNEKRFNVHKKKGTNKIDISKDDEFVRSLYRKIKKDLLNVGTGGIVSQKLRQEYNSNKEEYKRRLLNSISLEVKRLHQEKTADVSEKRRDLHNILQNSPNWYPSYSSSNVIRNQLTLINQDQKLPHLWKTIIGIGKILGDDTHQHKQKLFTDSQLETIGKYITQLRTM